MTKFERQAFAHHAIALVRDRRAAVARAELRSLVAQTCPAPNGDWDWKDNAAAWSAAIAAALNGIEDPAVRREAETQALALGLLTGYEAPRVFTLGVETLRERSE